MRKIVRSSLGRGLSSLISASAVPIAQTPAPQVPENIDKPETVTPSQTGSEQAASGGDQVRYVSIELLQPNRDQPRQHFAEAELVELAASLRSLGLIQPILVREITGQGKFEIVAGERRFRAASLAGLKEVPVIVRALSDRETLEVALVENIQRQNLNPLEEAKAYQRLMDEFSLTAAQVAEKVGKDRATVANVVRIIKLPVPVLEMIQDGRLSLGHAKAILTVKEPSAQISLAQKVQSENLSVRALEAIVSRSVQLEPLKPFGLEKGARGATQGGKKPVFPELEDRLRNSLGTKVSIHHSPSGKGRIELHYFSEGELDRLIEILGK